MARKPTGADYALMSAFINAVNRAAEYAQRDSHPCEAVEELPEIEPKEVPSA